MKRLAFLGASNMLSDFIDCALALDYRIEAIVLNQPMVDRPRTLTLEARLERLGLAIPVLDIDAFAPADDVDFALGTTAATRSELVERSIASWGNRYATLIHPSAKVSRFARVGRGCFVGAGSVIGPGADLGEWSFINRGVTVGHDTRIGSFARLMPGCNVGGHVDIGPGATVGMGACVIEELAVGREAFVAAGAVVLQDVPEGALVAGVPAKLKRTADDKAPAVKTP